MTKFLRLLAGLLFVLVACPAMAIDCRDEPMPRCFNYLPKVQSPDPAWQYSHECCDMYDDYRRSWYVYMDGAGNWYLVDTMIQS